MHYKIVVGCWSQASDYHHLAIDTHWASYHLLDCADYFIDIGYLIDLGVFASSNSIAKVWCFCTLRSWPDLLSLARWHIKVHIQVLYRLVKLRLSRCFDSERWLKNPSWSIKSLAQSSVGIMVAWFEWFVLLIWLVYFKIACLSPSCFRPLNPKRSWLVALSHYACPWEYHLHPMACWWWIRCGLGKHGGHSAQWNLLAKAVCFS